MFWSYKYAHLNEKGLDVIGQLWIFLLSDESKQNISDMLRSLRCLFADVRRTMVVCCFARQYNYSDSVNLLSVPYSEQILRRNCGII